MLRQIFDLTTRLSAISRYSQTHLIKSESVLEHTGFVAISALLIATSLDVDINYGMLLKKALVHDIDELATGDIPSPTKYANRKIQEAICEIEEENMKDISVKLYGDHSLYDVWRHAKDSSIEGQIIRLCDILAVLHKVHLEVVVYRNNTIFDHLRNVEKGLKAFKEGTNVEGLRKICDQAFHLVYEIKVKVDA